MRFEDDFRVRTTIPLNRCEDVNLEWNGEKHAVTRPHVIALSHSERRPPNIYSQDLFSRGNEPLLY